MRKRKGTDVVIVGLGAAGGLAAYVLARAGLEVVGLEAGGRLSVHDFAPDEIRNDLRNWFGREKVNGEIPAVRLNAAQTAQPQTVDELARTFALSMNGVGGSTVHWTGLSWRFHPWNFRTGAERSSGTVRE